MTGTLPEELEKLLRVGDHFDPETRTLTLNLEPPPTDNACHRSGRFSRYATKEYRDWLNLAGDKLRQTLGDWRPDTESWWDVEGYLFLPTVRTDGQNYIKAALDLLSGSQVVPKDVKDESGKIVLRKDQIIKPGGLWSDDKRVHLSAWRVLAIRCPEPALILKVRPASGPRDWKEAEKQRKAAEREGAREAKRLQKELEKAAKVGQRAGRRPAPVSAVGEKIAPVEARR